MTDSFLGDAFWVLSYQFWSTVLQCDARLPIHTLNCWTVQLVVPGFYLGVCLSVTLLIVDPWQSFVCFIRSGATRYTLIMVLYLDRMCQCGLHAVFWSHIHRFTYVLPCCRISQYRRTFIQLSVFLWNDLANPVFDGVGLAGFTSRANAFLLA